MSNNFTGWKNFEEFIEVANKSLNWLVLRNFEYLPNDFFNNDKDVDVLCEDLEQFVNTMKLTKRSWGISAYETVISNKVVPFDVRFLGDGYYDKLWEYKMLKNKVHTADAVPRMNDEDCFYSLIYHSKIQKHEVKEVYRTRFYALANSLNIANYDEECIDNNEYIANILNKFIKLHCYTYSVPIDRNVTKNEEFFDLLDDAVKYGVVFKTPLKVKVLNYIPSWILKIIPRGLKKTIKAALRWN